MNAVKPHRSQTEIVSTAANSAELTQQERRALSLVWRDDESDSLKTLAVSEATEHCAELGYN